MLKRICLFLLCLALFGLAACSGQHQDQAPQSPPSISTPAPNTEPVAPPPTNSVQEPVPSKQLAGGQDLSWYYNPNANHQVPSISPEVSKLLSQYQALYVVPNAGHKIYLTFDEGYELGYTGQILDTLKSNQIHAAFFITAQFLKTQPDLVKRMKTEGHLVCNHTSNHKDLATLSRENASQEITSLERSVQQQAGINLDKYMRPPMGNYSELSLAVTRELGYTTVFWSMALVDWDPAKQPGVESVYQHIIKNIHPGAIILLHGVSQSDTQALDRVIKELQQEGYVFSTFPA
ncbi:MAG TPA: polysaccharide deacetylase family protein [Syntrophomonadaceae bacterium]|nr:polysaccharide deacetylase family protein [Syntrophomonadaceae bacterium]